MPSSLGYLVVASLSKLIRLQIGSDQECPSVVQWIVSLWSFDTGAGSTAVTMGLLHLRATVWLNLTNIMPSDKARHKEAHTV